jgi:hypothetical protein
MGGVQKYLTRQVQDGEISKDDLLESQRKLSILNQAPKLVLSAIAKGWMSYPDKLDTTTEEEETAKWIDTYDCERAYHNRVKGMTYREIGKLMGCGMNRVSAILHHGENIVLQRKMKSLGHTIVSIPSKATVQEHITNAKSKTKSKQ